TMMSASARASAALHDRLNRSSSAGLPAASLPRDVRRAASAGCVLAGTSRGVRASGNRRRELIAVLLRMPDSAPLDGDEMLVGRTDELRLRPNQPVVRHLLQHVCSPPDHPRDGKGG